MKDELELVHEDTPSGGGFYLRVGDRTLGEMTYTKSGATALVFPHTWVDDSLRGEGRARQLLDAAVAWVRETDHKIIPVCPYVVGQFQKDIDLRDVRAVEPD